MLSTSKSFFRNPSAGGGGTTDPSFAYVPLLLNTGSTNGQQNNTFLDSSTNNFTITRNGTPTQGSRTPYWPNGQWSNYFSGTTQYLSAAYNATFNFASSTPLTIEFWFNTTGFSGAHTFISNYNGATTGWTVQYRADAGNVFRFSIGNTVILDSSAQTITAGVWYHVAVVRNSSNSVSIYLNGSSIATPVTNSGAFAATTQGPWIGGLPGIGQYYPGYISNFRIVNGSAVYTAAFTPPTTPLTAITNTVLLTCQSNRFIDNSSSPKTLTPSGTPSVQAFQPFSPAASYSAATYAGSGYFVASTSDTLLTSSSQIIPTGSFTIECWAYVTSSTATQAFVSQGTSGSAGRTAIGIDNSSGAKWFCQVGGVFVYSSAAPVLNTWNYLAMTYNGATIALYLNGTSLGSASNTTSAQNAQLRISGLFATPVAGYYLDGYLSNVRISNTVRTVTSVPTTPFVNDANTSLLLNMANAGIYDAAAQNDITTVGDAQASTTVAKWSPTSIKFDGTGDWLTAIDGPQLQLGTGDFTIDGWVYLSATGAIYGLISKGTATTGWSVNVTVLNKLQFSYTASNLTGATSLAASTWYYFAVVRSGSATGNLKVYLNGAVDATSGGAVTDNFNQTNILYVGADRIGTSPLNGYLQDVRITKAARTITTPTAAFPTR